MKNLAKLDKNYTNLEFIPYGTDSEMDKLVDSKSYFDRSFAAYKRYALYILVNDSDYRVRIQVAQNDYKLDKLVNDENYNVRITVAERGYGLNKLINDNEIEVSLAASYWLNNHNLTLEQWKEKYPDNVVKE